MGNEQSKLSEEEKLAYIQQGYKEADGKIKAIQSRKAEHISMSDAAADQIAQRAPADLQQDYLLSVSRSSLETDSPATETYAQSASGAEPPNTSRTTALKRPVSPVIERDEHRPRLSKLSKQTNACLPGGQNNTTALPRFAKRRRDTSPAPASDIQIGDASNPTEGRPPSWYKEMRKPTGRNKDEASANLLLDRLKGQITKCLNSKLGDGARAEALIILRDMIHNAAFVKVSGPLLKQKRMLDNDGGLPQLFDGCIRFDFDIEADAEELYNKWSRQVFETDLLRGIIPGKPKQGKETSDRSNDRIDPSYAGLVKAQYYGNGNLLNGQWWPTQLTALRDGAHGVSQGGISGKSGEGVYSCVMSGGNDYEDEDHGDWVLFCGTDSDNGTPTEHTMQMMKNVDNHRPVRLLRSYNMRKKKVKDGNEEPSLAPECGFRYDGLYEVVSFERLDAPDSMRQRHRFKLVRLAGQDPIRGGANPACRPNPREIEEHQKDKRLRGFRPKAA